MNYFTEKKFSFISKALPEDTFGVISMKGSEGISKPYEFEVMLVADNLEIDFDEIMQGTAKLVFHRETGDDAIYSGIITHFEYLHAIGDYAFYRAYLVPRLWWLSITRHNQIILDKSVPEFAQMVLIDGGLTADDFEFRLQGDYEPVEYVCQYNESHLNFLSRWLEREGIYYYFDQTQSGEKVIFTDTHVAHTDLAAGKVLTYLPPSGLDALHTAEVVKSFHCRRSLMPAKVFLKDYNYDKPSLEVTGEAAVDPRGRGTVFFYHEHIKTPEEGHRLAGIRAESIRCRRELYLGEGSVPFMLPGFTFTLDNHYRQGANRNYLITDIDHEGNQSGYLLAGITVERAGGDEENKIYYRNCFTAIPGSVQFRPEAKAEKPKISGTISGKIDAAGSGQYAELDPQGRYKIIFPFDLSGRTGGKASKWVRMAQPYAGSDHGMHFPLHKGTEVLITFIDGDPDRPIIAGAVPNPGTPSPVTGNNQTMSVLNTAGRNRIAMEDAAGSERMLFHSPNQGSYLRIGAPNDPPPDGTSTTTTEPTAEDTDDDKDIAGIKLSTPSGAFTFEAGAKNEICLGEAVEVTVGAEVHAFLVAMADICLGERFILDAGLKQELSLGLVTEIRKGKFLVSNKEGKLIDEKTEFAEHVNEVTGEKLIALDQEICVTNERIAANVSKMEAIESDVKARATHDEVAAVKSQAIAEANKAIASQTTAMAEKMEAMASHTRALEQDLKTLVSEVKIAVNATRSIAEETSCGAAYNRLTGLANIM